MAKRVRKARKDGWLTPPAGVCPHNAGLALYLTDSFECEPGQALEIVSEVVERVQALLGDHVAKAHFSVNRPGVSHLIGPWERRKLGHELQGRLSEFRNKDAFGAMQQAPWSWMRVLAERGGGAHRYYAWDLHLDAMWRDAGYTVTLAIDMRHIEFADAPPPALIEEFFRICGRETRTIGGYATVADATMERSLVMNACGSLGLNASIIKDPVRGPLHRQFRPWVYPLNHVGDSHLSKLGGIDRFTAEAAKARDELCLDFECLEPLPNGSLLIGGPRLAGDLLGRPSWYIEADPASTCIWLLQRFTAAGLMGWQSDDWLKERAESVREWRAQRALVEAEDRGAQPRQRKKDLRTLRAHLQQHPPRCAEGRVRPSDVHAKARNLTTRFEIVRGDDWAAAPVYGRWARGKAVLMPPVRVGSPTEARALFSFDPCKDGFDGEFGNADPCPMTPLNQFTCPSCAGFLFRCTVEFEYNDEELDLNDSSRSTRKQDYFDWFRLFGECSACRKTHTILDWECA